MSDQDNMNLGYKDYEAKVDEAISKLGAGLDGTGMRSKVELIISEKDMREIGQLIGQIKQLNEDKNELSQLYMAELKRQLLRAREAAVDSARKNAEIDRTHILGFFNNVKQKLEKDDSSESLKLIEKEISAYEKKFNKRQKQMMSRSFDFNNFDTVRERKKKVQEAIAFVREACQVVRTCINDIKMDHSFKKKSTRSGEAFIYDMTPLEALRARDLSYILPFLGGKEPLIIRMRRDSVTREKIFAFDRNVLAKIEGPALAILVKKFCGFFAEEIKAGNYMEIDFRDKKDVFRICEELVKHHEVKLDLEKIDLPNADKYKLVGIYIEKLRKNGKLTSSAHASVDQKTNENAEECSISKSNFEKLCARVKITPALQEYIWKEHKVRISDGTELTLNQVSSSAEAEKRLQDGSTNDITANTQVMC